MPKIEKLIDKMKQRPNGIRFDEVKMLLESYGYTMAKTTGTSHRHFRKSEKERITIKYENPLKAVYVKDVLAKLGL